MATEWPWRCWGELSYSIRTGKPAFDSLYGMNAWRYFAERDPEAGALFDQAMTALSEATGPAIAQGYDFDGVRSFVDVGGGQGSLLRAILTAHPHIETGILFDQPQVLAGAEARLRAARLSDRCRCIAGDFLEMAPPGADAYILKAILHDWDDERCVRILMNCREAMAPGGRVLAAEMVLGPHCPDPSPYFVDLMMLVAHTGRERTEEEFQALYRAAGLRVTRIIPTASVFSLVEGVGAEE
jgi:hypothetical protein